MESVYFNVVAHSAAGGQPFASLPSSLYGSGIAKQVFITRSRHGTAAAKVGEKRRGRKKETRTNGENEGATAGDGEEGDGGGGGAVTGR